MKAVSLRWKSLGPIASNDVAELALSVLGVALTSASLLFLIPLGVLAQSGFFGVAMAFYGLGVVLPLAAVYAKGLCDETPLAGAMSVSAGVLPIPVCLLPLVGGGVAALPVLWAVSALLAGVGAGCFLLLGSRTWCALFQSTSVACMQLSYAGALAAGAVLAAIALASLAAPVVTLIGVLVGWAVLEVTRRQLLAGESGSTRFGLSRFMLQFFVVSAFGGASAMRLAVGEYAQVAAWGVPLVLALVSVAATVSSIAVTAAKFGVFVDTVAIPFCLVFYILSMAGGAARVVGCLGVLSTVALLLVDNFHFMAISYFRSSAHGFQRFAVEFLLPCAGFAAGVVLASACLTWFESERAWLWMGAALALVSVTVLSLRPISVENLFDKYRYQQDSPNEEGKEAPSDEDPYIMSLSGIVDEAGLSKREAEVFGYLAKGRSASFIADFMCISVNTVKTHTLHIYQKVGVNSRQKLLDYCDEYRLRHS